ncbi:MAG: hypothetical protein V1792_29735 [Pseudomonadota bacterium]
MTTDAPPLNRPKNVDYALSLLYVHLATGVAVLANLPQIVPKESPSLLGACFLAYSFLGLFCLGFIFEIRNGKNWARVAFTILYAVGVSLCIGISIWFPRYSPFRSLWFSFQTVLGLLACMQLVHPNAAAWFKGLIDLKKNRSQRLESMIQEAKRLKDIRAFDAAPHSEPLIEVRHHPVKYLWRMVWVMPFALILFPWAMIWSLRLDDPKHELVRLGETAAFGFLFITSWYLLIRTFVLDSIRLYNDRIVKVRKLFRNIEIDLASASYMAFTVLLRLGYMRQVRVYRSDTSPWITRRMEVITYEEHLMASKDVEKLHILLAALTGRKPEEFDEVSVDIKRLVKADKE